MLTKLNVKMAKQGLSEMDNGSKQGSKNVDLRIECRAAAGKFMLLLHKALANAEAFKKYNQVMNFLLQICQLESLQILDLSFNNLQGTIPPCNFESVDKNYIDHLLIEWQGKEQIPNEVTNLHGCSTAYLSNNSLVGEIPRNIGHMTELLTLNLSRNMFSGEMPSSMSDMHSLNDLDVSFNNLSGRVPTSTQLQSFEPARFTGNAGLCGLPTTKKCPEDEYLGVPHDVKSGSDGYSTDELQRWFYVGGATGFATGFWIEVSRDHDKILLPSNNLDGCDLSHVMHPYSSSVNSSSSIHVLYLQKNNLSSPMYNWLCPLFGKNLGYLVISGNTFDGNLSDFLNTLSTSAITLYTLDASSNLFTGSLSDEIPNFSFLRYLDISLNQLNGTISDKLWQLPNLQELDISSNSLTGAISENMLNLSQSIQYIDFSSNKLGPRFPKWIQKLKNLSYLDLSNNSISDTVSTEYWNQWKSSQLSYLDLSFNNISGTLPKSLSNHDLDFIDLSFNCFYGPIPAFPARLRFLDLSINKFHGGLSFLCQLYENLEFLDISRNTLTGQLPDCFQNLTYLEVLNLGHKHICQKDSPSIGLFGQLETFYIDHLLIEWQGKVNEFSSILGLLKAIDLLSNNLTGKIPNEVTDLHGLNMFSGEMPTSMSDMHSLNDLDDNGGLPTNNQKCLKIILEYEDKDSTHGECGDVRRWFYIGGATGFATAFWIACVTLLFNRRLRHAFFHFHDCLKDWVYVKVVVSIARLQRVGRAVILILHGSYHDEDLGVPPVGESDGDGESTDELQRWFYIGGATGFATAFWIACSALLFNRRLRHAFFHFHNCLKDWVYVKVAVLIAKFQRAART
ncbi:leucine-rich repeat-containing protein [Tanacetum coccineum]|uniref:Leucine-rich repeat-containing protein n=1 Tax=Tanacetum coccineum TaxID=301880 RepID=A0ABQ5BC53_9ASTR